MEEHDQRLWTALERITLAGLNLDKQKCTFAVAKIRYLEEKISYHRVQVGNYKAEANTCTNTCTCRQQGAQQFFGAEY